MSPVLNWYKVLPTSLLDDPPKLSPRVLIHGGRSVKSGTSMQCWGVQYDAKPKITRFELFRRHFLSRSKYSRVDTVPATFARTKEMGHVALSQHIPLRTLHSRLVNRTFQFRDEFGNRSSDISTSRFGHIELTTAEVDVSAGAAGHVPYAKVKIKGLLKPIKDPLMGLSVLVPGRVIRWTDVTSALGYSSLEEIVEAEIADVETGEDLSAIVSELLLPPPEFRIDVQPPELEIRESEAGSFDMTVELFQAGTLSFAVQAIPLREDDRLLAASLVDDPEDPLDDILLGVIVSDVCSVSMSESAGVAVT